MPENTPEKEWNSLPEYLGDQLDYDKWGTEKFQDFRQKKDESEVPLQIHHLVLGTIEGYKGERGDGKQNGKITYYKRKKFKMWAALAASLILVLGVSVNTFGSKDYVISVVNTIIDNKLSVQVSRGDLTGPMEVDRRAENSMKDINNKLGIKQTLLGYLPRFMSFENYSVNIEDKTARTLYKDKDENVMTYTITMDKANVDDSLKTEHRLLQEYNLLVDSHDIYIREVENEETNEKQFIATFADNNVFYEVASTVEKEAFDKTIKKLYFL